MSPILTLDFGDRSHCVLGIGVNDAAFCRCLLMISRLAWSWVGGRLAPFYIHQMNRVNSRNGSAMMTAP